MFSVIRNIWDLFWEGIIILSLFFSLEEIYQTMRTQALTKASEGLPSLSKFNQKLWEGSK